jgi:hypothetical protein
MAVFAVLAVSASCYAVTVPAQVTNTVELPWSPTNGPTFYRIMEVPPVPGATNEASAPSTSSMKTSVKIGNFTNDVSFAFAVDIDKIATLVTVTNWSDFPPANTAPVTTTLADHTQGLEYGTIVTNKIIQVIEEGAVHPVIVHSYTNGIDVITRLYEFKRVHNPATLRHHIKRQANVR